MPRKRRKVFHVVPNPEGKWIVRREGEKKVSETFDRKKDAVGYARDEVHEVADAKVGRGKLIIHKKDGTIQREHHYGSDAHPPLASRKSTNRKGTSNTGPRRK